MLLILTWYLVCGCIMIFTFDSGPMIFGSHGPWTLKFAQIFSCHHFFSLCLEILTWFLVYECIMMSYRSFCSCPMIFGRVMALRIWNFAKYLLVTTFFAMLGVIYLIFGIWVYSDELQITFKFRSGPMIFGRVMALGLWHFAKYLVAISA